MRTAYEWNEFLGTRILDWDGFRDGTITTESLITREEFEQRAVHSTRFYHEPIGLKAVLKHLDDTLQPSLVGAETNLSAPVLAEPFSLPKVGGGEVRESTKPAGRSNAEVTDNSCGAQNLSIALPLGGRGSAETGYGG